MYAGFNLVEIESQISQQSRIQKHSNSSWATVVSLLLRLNSFEVSESDVLRMYEYSSARRNGLSGVELLAVLRVIEHDLDFFSHCVSVTIAWRLDSPMHSKAFYPFLVQMGSHISTSWIALLGVDSKDNTMYFVNPVDGNLQKKIAAEFVAEKPCLTLYMYRI